MRRFVPVFAFAVASLIGMGAAGANVTITIDKSTQRMAVAVDGAARYTFPVSTGRAGYGTPSGVYHPERLARTWFSRKYYNSPMPHSIFFHGGFAIHGSYEISRLGGPASHGCVRLHPANAATLYALVQQEGIENTRIVVTGATAPATHLVRARPYPEWDEAPYRQPYVVQRPAFPFFQQPSAYPAIERPGYGRPVYRAWSGW